MSTHVRSSISKQRKKCFAGKSVLLKDTTRLELATLDLKSNTLPVKDIYQSPLILTELFQHNLINVSYLTVCYLYQVMMTVHFLNDVANDTKSTQT